MPHICNLRTIQSGDGASGFTPETERRCIRSAPSLMFTLIGPDGSFESFTSTKDAGSR